MHFRLLTLTATVVLAISAQAALTDQELDSVGRRVWKNECGGTRDGLTSWNAGENFASLGIGHFIWYPKGVRGPFDESFPRLVEFLQENGAKVPAWLRETKACPWSSKAEFQAEFRGERMNELRDLLASTIRLQSRFLAMRMEAALPKMLGAAPAGDREKIRENFQRLTTNGAGTFALIDYVNFKGEGTKETERYKGEGWGLLQVLAGMNGGGNAAREFGESAARVLERRVKNAPAGRNEAQWLPGWKNRVRAYGA
ncbi:MAG TPA: hypothetical protein VF614_05380 [Chthoniobacteraceae bacterium]